MQRWSPHPFDRNYTTVRIRWHERDRRRYQNMGEGGAVLRRTGGVKRNPGTTVLVLPATIGVSRSDCDRPRRQSAGVEPMRTLLLGAATAAALGCALMAAQAQEADRTGRPPPNTVEPRPVKTESFRRTTGEANTESQRDQTAAADRPTL